MRGRKSKSYVTLLHGRKVGLWGGPFAIPPRAFFRKYGLRVHEVPQSYTVNLFLHGGIDVASAMWYNEYHTILNAGIDPDELSIFLLKDYGIDLPEDGLYTIEKTLKNDPGLAKGFAQASLDGWNYAFAHPEETLDVVIRYMREAKLPADRMHQKWMLERLRDLIISRGNQGVLGILSRSDYTAAGQILLKNGEIRTLPGFKAFMGQFDAQQ
ncbi:ABC transporter substrate-binding protein [Syntrophus gentianae]|nr:ABC transporter substrate-binding protein [Syntrophus gentianae]